MMNSKQYLHTHIIQLNLMSSETLQQKQSPLNLKEHLLSDNIEFNQHQDQTQNNSQPLPSQFIEKYKQQQNCQDISPLQEIKDAKQELESNGILYHSQVYEKLSIQYFPNSRNYEVLTANVAIGSSKFRIRILNTRENCAFSSVKSISSHNQSQIYLTSFRKQEFVLKALLIKNQLNKRKVIHQAIKEYCFLKFCSSIQCGPLMKGYLGFDIIVYDDCIMFAMEKVKMLKNITQKSIKYLKGQLSVMHSFKMVHLDIKPENISFSPHFKKEIFIDFGLSQFIEEELGEKTLSQFRGSIKCCGPEMLNLFISGLQSSQIDLYYNDAQSLQKSINQMNQDIDCPNEFNAEQQILNIYESNFNYQPKQNNTQKKIFIILFKYHICFLNHETVIQLLKNHSGLDINDYRYILKFIKQLTPFLSRKEIYNQYFICFKDLPEYQQISQYLNGNSKVYYYQKLNEQMDDENTIQNLDSARSIFSNYSQQSGNFKCISSANIKENKMKFITNFKINHQNKKNSEELSQVFFSHYLYCIRFDNTKQHYTMQQKNILSKSFLQLFFKNAQISQQSLSNLQNCLIYLLQYCFIQPYNNWKKKQLFLILQQSIYLDIDLTPFLSKIQLTINHVYLTIFQKILCFIDIFKITSLLNFKHLSNNCKNIQNIFCFFDQISHFIKGSLLEAKLYQSSQSIIVLQTLQYLARSRKVDIQPDIQMVMSQIQQLDSLCDYELADIVKRYMFYQQMHRYLYSHNVHPCLRIFDIFKALIAQKWTKEIGFQIQYYLAIGIDLMIETRNITELLQIFQYLKDTIICNNVYCLFKFDLLQFLFQRKYSEDLLKRFVLQFKRSEECSSLLYLTSQYFQIAQILKRAKPYNFFAKEIIQIFNSIKYTYFLSSDKINEIQKWQEAQFQIIKNDAIIFSWKLSEDSEVTDFLNKTIFISKDILPVCKSEIYKKKIKLIERMFKGICYHDLRLSQKAYFQFQGCLALAIQFSFHNLAYLFLSKLVTISNSFFSFQNKLYNRLKTYLYHNMFYEVNKQNNTILSYLNNKIQNYQYVFYALQAFYIQGLRQQIFIFLIDLAEVITQYPFSTYIEEWVVNLNKFYSNHSCIFNATCFESYFPSISWKNCYLICYYVFCLGNKDDDKILKKISQNLQNINNFTKNKFLHRYYKSFVEVKDIRKRQKQLLQTRLLFRYEQKCKLNTNYKVKQLKLKKSKNNKIKLLYRNLKRYLT